MPKSCAVYQCSATSENEKNRSFHQFPQDPKLRQAWITRIRREGYTPRTLSYVCSFHFFEEDFNKGGFSTTPQEFKKKRSRKDQSLVGISEGLKETREYPDAQHLPLNLQDVQKLQIAQARLNLPNMHLFPLNGHQWKWIMNQLSLIVSTIHWRS